MTNCTPALRRSLRSSSFSSPFLSRFFSILRFVPMQQRISHRRALSTARYLSNRNAIALFWIITNIDCFISMSSLRCFAIGERYYSNARSVPINIINGCTRRFVQFFLGACWCRIYFPGRANLFQRRKSPSSRDRLPRKPVIPPTTTDLAHTHTHTRTHRVLHTPLPEIVRHARDFCSFFAGAV